MMMGVIATLLNVVYCYCHLRVVDDDSVSVSVSNNEFHVIFCVVGRTNKNQAF